MAGGEPASLEAIFGLERLAAVGVPWRPHNHPGLPNDFDFMFWLWSILDEEKQRFEVDAAFRDGLTRHLHDGTPFEAVLDTSGLNELGLVHIFYMLGLWPTGTACLLSRASICDPFEARVEARRRGDPWLEVRSSASVSRCFDDEPAVCDPDKLRRNLR